MNKLDNREIDIRAWEKEIVELTRRQSPEKRAYMIIRNFFESQEPSEDLCRDFKEWFASDEVGRK